ncbi:hypothetical protein [Haliangium ochraceum]|nr:hypothetical protein [Haliangium ochraceum]
MSCSLVLACALSSAAHASTNHAEWRWVQEGGYDGLINARGVATDRFGGYSCAVGSFVGTVALGHTVGDPVTGADGPVRFVTTSGTSAAYVTLRNDAGQVLWAHVLDGGATGTVELADVDIVETGSGEFDCVIAGHYEGDVAFDSGFGATVFTSTYGDDAFVARYTENSLAWVRELIGYGDDAALGVSVSEIGDIAVGGHFDTSTSNWLLVKDTDPGETVGSFYTFLYGDGGREGFVVSYDAAGTPRWGEALGGPGDDEVRSVAASGDRVFVAGGYENGMTLLMYWAGAPYTRTFSHVSALGSNPFMVPLDAADGRAHWTEIVEQGTSGDSFYNHVYADASGFYYEGVVMITGTLSGSSGASGLYYHVLDFDLDHRESFSASTSSGDSEGMAGWVDTSGDEIRTIWVAGRYTGSVPALDLPSSSNWHGFVRRYSELPTETFLIDGSWDSQIYDLDATSERLVGHPGGAVEPRYRAYVAGTFPFSQNYSEAGDIILSSSSSAGVAQIGNTDVFYPPSF